MRDDKHFVGILSENLKKRMHAAAADRNKARNRNDQGDIAGSTPGMLLIPTSPGAS